METFPISHILPYIPEKSKDKIIPCAHGLAMLLKVSQALFFFSHKVFIDSLRISYHASQSRSFPSLSMSTLHSCSFSHPKKKFKNKMKTLCSSVFPTSPSYILCRSSLGAEASHKVYSLPKQRDLQMFIAMS